MKKLFLLDAFALIFRAHYAFIKRPLINSKGVNTSAVTGFVNVLWDLLQKEKPSHLAVCFDLSGPTFRHDMFPAYKANREETPEDIVIAVPYIREILKAWNIPILQMPGYEADDVVGTISKQAEKAGFQVYMMTPDKDYGQLVSPNIFMYKPARLGNELEIWDEAKILSEWGIKRVDQVIDMLGLQGDAVDNIPGVPGIGPKSAQKLLEQFDTIENILANTHLLQGKQKEALETFADQAILSKKLAAIDLNVPIEFDEEDCKMGDPNKEALGALFKELEFRSLSNRILGQDSGQEAVVQLSAGTQGDLFGGTTDAKPAVVEKAAYVSNYSSGKAAIADKNIENTEHQYHIAQTAEERQALIKALRETGSFAFDTETTGLETVDAEIVGLSFSFKAQTAWYVPVPQKGGAAIMSEFKDILEDSSLRKIGQNIKFDALMLRNYGIHLQGDILDTMVVHYLLEPDKRHGMDYLSETYLNYTPVPIEALIGKGKAQLSMRDVPLAKIAEYAAEDADVTWQLAEKLQPLLEPSVEKLYKEIEAPLIMVLADVEAEGINLDSKFLEAYSKVLDVDIQAIQKEIFEMGGVREINLNSPAQIGQLLFDKLKIPYRWKKTATAQYSTDEEKLSELAYEHVIVQKILDYRQLAKLKSTYVDALPRMVNAKTGRLHTSFNQALAQTGRLSSQNPNLQNIPVRSERGREVRKAFIPRDANHVLMAADYSQIELRLIAEISGDPNMLEAFQNGQDIHAATAAKIYNVPIDQVTKEQRYNAKTVNFSIIYGAGSTNLSRQLSIKRAEAQVLIDAYFAQYSGIKEYMEKTVKEARETGFVSTLMGRRRYLRDINSNSSLMRSNDERIAVNTPIQGSAADMIKIAMINIHQALKDGGFKTKMLLQVHDELVFDVPKDEVERVSPIIEHLMKTALPNLKVPIEVGIDTGENWLEAH